MSGREIELTSLIPKEEFLAGWRFLGIAQPVKPSPKAQSRAATATIDALKDVVGAIASREAGSAPRVPTSKSQNADFKMPLLRNNVLTPSKDPKTPVPRHDPKAPGALVMKRPASVPNGRQAVDVVVDPILTKHLREHQRAGVAFMYECVMGMRPFAGEGAILADEMGLGKTLQTIALLWTLLKQNPIHEEQPVIKKALIVCPVTLINNWRKEIRKWLGGSERIGVLVAEDKRTRVTDFTLGKSYSVMIIGYEKLRTVKEDLQKGTGIDIVIADEGHRLKTAKNKSADAIKSLNTERRIILSGTPIQNDLEEFYTMVDFVNPGLLNKYSVFKREFETPILRSQQPGASSKDLEKGEARSEELANITGMFILRRTAEILAKYLPPKTEYVVFCRPTRVQAQAYRAIIGSPAFNAALGSSAVSLELINVLKKVCNSPSLLLRRADKGEDTTKSDFVAAMPPGLLKSPGASSKLQVLDSLLHHIRTTTDDKVVLVSNYTSTMDILASLLTSLSYKYLRLDGTTPPSKRQELVDRFNRSPPGNAFVFLLSAKAGGTGLNLIGASRLVLYDLDWNPATDLQAMARIHRDGQKKPSYIYRLLVHGALDEKIFQRQVSKTGLADSIVDGKSGASGFSREELRDLFSFDAKEDCQTHRLLGCQCGGDGMPLVPTAAPDVRPAEQDQDGEVEEPPGEDSLEDFKSASQFTSSAEVDMEAQEAEIRRKMKECKDSSGRAKMLSLMQYTHFDTSLVDSMSVGTGGVRSPAGEEEEVADVPEMDPLEGVIEDAALRSVLREDGRRVSYVFSKVGS